MRQLEICAIRTDHQVGWNKANTILNKKNQSKAGCTLVGESWGPSLYKTDSKREVYPAQENHRRDEYRQAFIRGPAPRGPRRTSSVYSDSTDDDNMQVDSSNQTYDTYRGGFTYKDRNQRKSKSDINRPGPSGENSKHTGEKTHAKHTGEKTAISRSNNLRYVSDVGKHQMRTTLDSTSDWIDYTYATEIKKRNSRSSTQTGFQNDNAKMPPPPTPDYINEWSKKCNSSGEPGKHVYIDKIYVHDHATQCGNTHSHNISTQTDLSYYKTEPMMSFNSNQMINLIKFFANTTKVVDRKTSFSCKGLANMLSSLTGLEVTTKWVLDAFEH